MGRGIAQGGWALPLTTAPGGRRGAVVSVLPLVAANFCGDPWEEERGRRRHSEPREEERILNVSLGDTLEEEERVSPGSRPGGGGQEIEYLTWRRMRLRGPVP